MKPTGSYLTNHGGNGGGNRKRRSSPGAPNRGGTGPGAPNRGGTGPGAPNRGGGGPGAPNRPDSGKRIGPGGKPPRAVPGPSAGGGGGSGGGGGGSAGGKGRKGPSGPSQMPIKNVRDLAKFVKGEGAKHGFSKAGLKQGLRHVPGLFMQGAKTALKSQVRQLGARFVRGTVGRLLGNHQTGQGYPAQRAAAAKKRAQAAALRKSVARSSRSR